MSLAMTRRAGALPVTSQPRVDSGWTIADYNGVRRKLIQPAVWPPAAAMKVLQAKIYM